MMFLMIETKEYMGIGTLVGPGWVDLFPMAAFGKFLSISVGHKVSPIRVVG